MSQTDQNLAAVQEGAAKFAEASKRFGLLGRSSSAGWLNQLSSEGWLGALLPEEVGGSSLTALQFTGVAMEFGRKLLPAFVSPSCGLAALSEMGGVSASLMDAALEGSGVIAPVLRNTASAQFTFLLAREGGQFVLKGKGRAWRNDSAIALLLVEAEFEGGAVVLAVPSDAPGVRIDSEISVDGRALQHVVCGSTPVSADYVIASGDLAAEILYRLRARLQLGLAAETLGAASEAFDLTLEYLRTRRAFGRSIGEYQALQHRAVDIYAALEAAKALVQQSALALDRGSSRIDALVAASRAKSGSLALQACKWAIQMHGAIGFTDACDIGMFLKHVMVLTRMHGLPELHRETFGLLSNVSRDCDPGEAFASDEAADAAFRQEVRRFIDEVLPERLRFLPNRPSPEDADWWQAKLFERGWVAPAWPREYGGMEATIAQRLILLEELAAAGAPEVSGQGLNNIGPILIRHGTEAQKQKFLPLILSGKIRWCQGYSEPNAGSDLASLTTRGDVVGDKIVINGQKTWTTGAQDCDWMFALVRTDPAAEDRRNGISMVLIDMRSKGVSVRPIRTVTGEDEFAEVFLDDVEVPLENVVSGLNQGWKLANALLESERLMNAAPHRIMPLLDRVKRTSHHTGVIRNEAFRDRLAIAEIDVLASRAAFATVLGGMAARETAGNTASYVKLLNSELLQTLADLLFEAAGEAGADWSSDRVDGRPINAAYTQLLIRRVTIYGGTSEIQRNIIASRILKLTANQARRKS